MIASEDHPLHISDILVLIVASAIGLGVIRFLTHFDDFPRGRLGMESLVLAFSWTLGLVWSVAVLLLHLKGPMPRWRRLTLRPGFAAVLAVTVAAVVFLVANAQQISHVKGSRSDTYYLIWRFLDPKDKAGTVAAVWLLMALGERWRPHGSWLDASGRWLGYFWLAALPVLGVMTWLES